MPSAENRITFSAAGFAPSVFLALSALAAPVPTAATASSASAATAARDSIVRLDLIRLCPSLSPLREPDRARPYADARRGSTTSRTPAGEDAERAARGPSAARLRR